MVNLDSIKLVIFDFDDTLCIHNKHGVDTQEYDLDVCTNGIGAWRDCSVNLQMKKFIGICETKNILMGFCSATTSYIHMENKQKWIYLNYGVNMLNFCVGSPELKIPFLRTVANSLKIFPSEVLIIDDYSKTLNIAVENNFKACNPMEIVNYINNKKQEEIIYNGYRTGLYEYDNKSDIEHCNNCTDGSLIGVLNNETGELVHWCYKCNTEILVTTLDNLENRDNSSKYNFIWVSRKDN